MKDIELRLKLEFLDRFVEEQALNTVTPNMEQTADRWSRQAISREQRSIFQLQEVRQIVKEIIESRIKDGS